MINGLQRPLGLTHRQISVDQFGNTAKGFQGHDPVYLSKCGVAGKMQSRGSEFR